MFERKGFAREMVSNCNVGATTYTVCKRAREEFKDMIVGNHKIHYLHQTTTTSSNLIFCLLRDIFLRSLSTKFPSIKGRIAFASWPCLACQVVFETKDVAREMVSNCNVGATTYTVCWVGTDQGAASLEAT